VSVDLRELVPDSAVRARVRVADRAAALDAAGHLLVGCGAVEERYVAALHRTFEELGPYAVIAPGIAIPHARPEDGVIRAAIAVLSLAEPVAFGHSANDPVDLVLAFAAVDKQGHLLALQQLAELLGDDDAVARLRAADSAATLRAALLRGAGAPT
jgi:ascorbate PTS system EIIA or EIIAB component